MLLSRRAALASLLLLVFALALPAPSVVQARDGDTDANEPDATGRWLGTITSQGQQLLAELRVARDADGELVARLLVPLANLNWVELENLRQANRTLSFDVRNEAGTALTGNGRLSADGKSISGRVVTSDGRAPFTFRRVPYLQELPSYERWRGRIVNVLDNVVVELATLPDGRWLGALTGPDPEGRLTEFPLHDITVDGSTLTIRLRTTNGRSVITLQRDANGRRLDGQVQTSTGAVTPVQLARDYGLGGNPDASGDGDEIPPDANIDYQRWLGRVEIGDRSEVAELRLRGSVGQLTGRFSWVEGGFVWKDLVSVRVIDDELTFTWAEGDRRVRASGTIDDSTTVTGTFPRPDGTTASFTLERVPAIEQLPLVEVWHSRLGAGENEVNVMLLLGRDANGRWFGSVTTDLPTEASGEFVVDVPLSEVSVDGNAVRLRVPSISRRMTQLELTRGDDRMSGAVVSNGNRTPVRLRLVKRYRVSDRDDAQTVPDPQPTPADDSPAIGRWLGTTDWGREPQVMEIRLRRNPEATETDGWEGRIALPQQGIPMSPLDGFEIDGPDVKLRLDIIDGDFPHITTVATISEDGARLTGKLLVDGAEHAVTLRRVPYFDDADDASIWNGHVDAAGTKVEMNVALGRDHDGNWMGSFDFVAEGYRDLPFSEVKVDGRKLQLTMPTPGIQQVIFGEISEDGQSFKGSLMAGGQFLPVELKRVERRRVARRPQEPQPPYPYDEHEVTVANGDIELAGTLTTPRGDGPFPAVVLITGSGPQDRNERIMGHKPFLVIADYLTRRGVAVLRCDDRGVGGSGGALAGSTTADLATDAWAAVRFLQGRDDIDGARIGLLGHSEGGLIAPMVAADHPDAIAFAVLLAGPGVPGADVIREQSRLIALANGGSEALANAQDAMLANLIDAVTTDNLRGDALRERVTDEVRRFLLVIPEDDRNGQPAAATLVTRMVGLFDDAWMRYFLTHDPAAVLERVTCPVLALNGTKDLQVPWEQNLPRIFRSLVRGGNTSVTIRALPDLNHLFQTCSTGSPNEYGAIEETFAPSALQLFGEWIEEQVARH